MQNIKITLFAILGCLMAQLAFAECVYGDSYVPLNGTVCVGSMGMNMTVHTCEGTTFVNNGTKCTCADDQFPQGLNGYVGCQYQTGYITSMNELSKLFASNKYNGLCALQRNSAK